MSLHRSALPAALGALSVLASATAQESAPLDATAWVQATEDPGALRALLGRCDIAAAAPASFRTRMRLTSADREESVEIEVWRADGRTLVRFLGAKQRGKYLLYVDAALWFISPGAKKPVKLPRSFRLQGSATLDDILGFRYSRDYSISRAETRRDADGPLVRLHLVGLKPSMQYPVVLYVIRPEAEHPASVELRLKSGKPATSLEFVEWFPGARLQPRLFVLRDLLRGGNTTRVEVLSFEEPIVPKGLFELASGAERRRLEEQDPEARP